VFIGSGASVGANVQLGEDCRVESHAIIGDGVILGSGCIVEAGATVAAHATLGARVRIGTGARIGGPGYRFHQAEAAHQRVPHVGGCVLEDDVEVGSNSTVDRGSIADTVVGAGTKIDCQVHVGHNVRIGARCLIMAQVGIAGSTVVEDDVILAGQVGLAGHLRVGARARVAAQAGVIGNVEPAATVSGYPARSHRDVLRQSAALRRLAPLVDRLEELARGH
jgi:UDP-3-O-[3-hydroxymyristoyl] glucosamine N-acyltransferase